MGDVQSTQRGSRQDAAAEEESREVDNPQTEQNTKHETFKNSEQSSDISRKGDEVKMNGCHEDENGAQEAAPETQVDEEESQGEVDANDGVHLQITELDVKQNDINSFGRFFRNIGLKLTINRGSGEKVGDDNKETTTEEFEETKTEKTEDKTEGEAEQDSSDSTGPILTAVASENVLENADKSAETTEEPELRAESEQEPDSTNPTGPGDMEIDSPIRRFFARGIFAGLWKKKEEGDETTEKELEEMGENQVTETAGQTAEEQRDEEPTAPSELRDEIPGKSPEPDILDSQDRDRVQMSPLLRFLSGSNLKRLSMKQRNIKSSDARLCDSGEHPAELLPSEPAEDHRNTSAPTSAEAAKEEEGAWASFKRFMSPKPRMKKSYHSAEETQQPASVEEPKAEQTSDHSSEEGNKRKNSSVSWEAVLCGSGRRRSRKTSDSEDEMPPIDLKYHKQDGKPKSGEESGAENEKETTSPKLDGSPQDDDGGSTWKSLKRIVTPKRKSRDEDEAIKIKIQSDGEGGQENSSFSIKNLLPGRKKQRSEERQGRVSSDEAGKDLASDDEDFETPGVVPLSEFEVDEEENKSLEEKEKLELQQDQGVDVNLCFPQGFDEDSEKQDTNEGLDNVTELASKHQQLSDIPEEGVIMEPWATLASLTEEAEGRGDTMVEDLREVTSEAITAPEPAADLTLQDETEMFTAASQFSSESATTSGNATPVPAERHIVKTDTVLHQVAETFSTSPQTTTLEPEQTSEGCAKKESTILEMHRRLDATSTESGLNVEDLEALGGLVSASLREGISEVAEFKSGGFVSEGAIEEFDSTGHTEVEDEERPSAEEEDVQDLAKELAEDLASEGGNETGEKESREAGDETLPLTEANVGAEDAKQVQEPEIEGPVEAYGPSLEPKVIYDSFSMCLGTETGGGKPELETCLLTDVILEQLDAKSVDEPEDLQAEQASSLNRQEDITSSHEPPMISENPTTAETAKDEADETQILTETVEPAEAPQKLEVLCAVQELSSNVGEVSILFLETEVASSETPKEINVSDDIVKLQELKDCTGLTEDSHQLVESSTTVEEPEVSQAASSLASDKGNIASVETEQKADNIPKEEIDVRENKKESTVTKATLESEEASTISEEPEVMKTVWPPALGSEEDNGLAPETQIILKVDLDTDEDKIQTKLLTEDTSEPLDDGKNVCMAVNPIPEESEHPSLVKEAACDHVSEEEPVPDEPKQKTTLSDTKLQSVDPSETVQEAEVSQVLKQSLESEETKQEPPDNISGEETIPDEPGDETTVAGETSSEPVDDSKTAEVAEELETVETSSLVREESSISPYEPEETPENTESDKDENKAETTLYNEYLNESEDAVRVLNEPEELKTVLQAECQTLAKEETAADEPEDVKRVATESLFEKVDDYKPLQMSSFESEESSIPSSGPEASSENVLKAELDTDQHKTQTTSITDDTSEPLDDPQNVEETQLSPTVQPSSEEPEKIPVSTLEAEETSENTPKAETVPDKTDKEKTLDPEDHETVEELESEHPSMVKEVTSDHDSEEPVPDEPKQETILSDTNPQSVDPSETVEEAEVSQVLKQSLESEVCKEEPSENISEEETVPFAPGDEINVADETSSEPVDDSKIVQIQEEPIQTVQTSSLVSQESSRSTLTAEETSENIPKVETVLVMVEASEAKPAEEPELSQTVQVSSLESEDNSVPLAEPEITSQIILTEETLPDEPGDETTVAGETSSEPVDDSKTAEIAEELETVETSSLVREESSISPYEPEETPENTESDKDENKAETTLYNECLNESEDAARVLNEPEELKTVLQAECQTLEKEETAADEPEDVKRVATESLFEKVDDYKPLQMSSFESEKSSIPSSGPEASSENVLKAELDTDQHKTQTTSITDDTSEPPDDPQNVEETQLSPTVQPSSEEPEKIPVSTLEAEETSENTPKAETVPDKTDKEKTLDPEDHETVEELESEHPSMVKEVTSDHDSEEPVPDKPKQETILSDTNPQSVDPSETVEEAEVSQVLKQSLESEECKEEPSENISEEETVPFAPGDEINVADETSSEPVDDSKTVQIREEPLQTVQTSSLVSQESSRSTLTAEETSENIPKVETVLVMVEAPEAKPAEEPELSQTVQLSSGQSEDNSVPSAEPEITSQIILTEETLSDEPKEELKLHSEITLEPEEPSETDGEAEVLKDVHPQSLESEESRGQSPEGEVTSDNISEETTDKPRDETTVAGETSTEPVDESKTVEVVEELKTVQTSSLVSQESSRSTLTAEEPSENIPKVKLDAVENQVETVLVMVEASEAKPAEEPELSQTVQVSSLESEDNSVHSAEPEITSQIILTEETLPDEPGDETTVAGETSSEPVDDSTTAEVVELETVETSSLVREESSISPYEPEETSKNILKAGSDVDENKVETRLVTEEQPEFSQTVQSSALESEDNTVPSAEPEITSEIIFTEETAPDEPGDKTAAVGEAICGQNIKELQTKQTSSQEENKSSSPPPEAEETSDTSKAETVSGETKEEITLDPEDTESANQSEALTVVNTTPESEHPSMAKEATCAHTSGEEMVPDEHKEGTINEILDASTPVQELELVQDVIIPSLDSGELEVKSNNVAEAGTDTVLISEVRFKPVDIQEPEVLKTVQAASFESVEASDETQVTPENIPKAEPAPKEEDLTVKTTTDDLKTEQVKDNKCSGTETETVEDEDPTALHTDKCHPKDVSEAVPDVLREQTSEALMDTTQAEEGVKEQVEAATPSVRDGVAEEVEEGKAEDTVEVAVVDAGTTSEGTTVDSVLEVEEMEVKDVMDVCCGVVHAAGSLSANKELEKEQILKEDKATTQEEKVQVDDEVEEKESTTVLATEASHSPPVTKAKEVNQDERTDAEENIDIQEETAGSFNEAEEPLESQRGGEQVEQAGLGREVETAHASKIEAEGSKETNKADEACQFESKEEDCDVALEHPGNTSTAAVSLTG